MSFLTDENAGVLIGLVVRYFRERRGVTLAPEAIDVEVRQAMIAVVQEARSGKLKGDVETLNRRVVASVVQSLTTRTAAPAPPPEPESIEPSPPPMTEEEPNKDIDFMNKLKALEMVRRMPLEAATPSAATEVKSTMDLLLPQMRPANLPTQIATVFMPQPVVHGQELLINSWQRNWVQYPNRNGFLWNGPLPPGVDLTESRVSHVLLPRACMETLKSPYLVLQLEGAGGQMTQSILVPESTSSLWGTFVPAAATLGYLKPLACPWRVKLLTADGRLLELGKDGETVRVGVNGITNSDAANAVANVASKGTMSDASKGAIRDASDADQLWVFGSKGHIHLWNVEKTNPWTGHWEDGRAPEGESEGAVVNFTRQWSILIHTVPRRAGALN